MLDPNGLQGKNNDKYTLLVYTCMAYTTEDILFGITLYSVISK